MRWQEEVAVRDALIEALLEAALTDTPAHLLQQVVTAAASILVAEACYLFLQQRRQDPNLALFAVPGWTASDPGSGRRGDDLPPKDLLYPNLLPGESDVRKVFQSARPQTVKVTGGRSLLVPLTIGEETIGVLAVSSGIPGALAGDALTIATAIARFAAAHHRTLYGAALGPLIADEITTEISLGHPELTVGGQSQLMAVIFADLAGSTEFSVRYDGETTARVFSVLLGPLARAVRGRGGSISNFLGDAFVAHFSGKDKSLKAVLAAWEAQEELAKVHAELPEKHRLGVRIGIATAITVMGTVGTLGASARVLWGVWGLGSSLAARLQHYAGPPHWIIIDLPTMEAVVEHFILEDTANLQLKGFGGEGVKAYHVIARKALGN